MKILYGIDGSGVRVATLAIDGDTVRIDSKVKKINRLSGKTLRKRVARKAKGIIADGFVLVNPGDPGYPDAVIDTLEIMGINVVG